MLLRAVWTEANRLDPFKQAHDTGNLGRLADHLTINNRNVVNAFSIDEDLGPIEGKQREIIKASVNSNLGFKKFNPSALEEADDVKDAFEWINGEQNIYSNKFAETWSSTVVSTNYSTCLSKIHQNIKSNYCHSIFSAQNYRHI